VNFQYFEEFFESLFSVETSWMHVLRFNCIEATVVIADTAIIEAAFDPGCPIELRDFVYE
jgi:hypothetical protein